MTSPQRRTSSGRTGVRWAVAGAVLALVLCAARRQAAAYPQFQFSSGTTTCGQCHTSPAGGGLVSGWGRSEAGDTISTGGNGDFLHGAWTPPSWLRPGLDLRSALLVNDVGGYDSPRFAAFPMQVDAYLQAELSHGVSINGTVGLMGIVRPDDDSSAGRYASAFQHYISREHYVMWRPSASGPYVRAGRFLAPYGLRLAEHIAFVRRYTGVAHSEESYNVSGGYLSPEWEMHLTAFMPVPEGAPEPLQAYGFRSSGFVGYLEKRIEDWAGAGGQMRFAFADDQRKLQLGAVGKIWWEGARLLFLAEMDFMRESFPRAGGAARNQVVSYLGVTAFPWRGVMPGVSWERYHEDLSLPGVARDALNAQVNWFPWAHFELQLLGRLHTTGLGNGGPTSRLLMLQFHYYL